jgi:peptidoglycan/xylan/chitin deacetylase (PgdA/CDA1 family)
MSTTGVPVLNYHSISNTGKTDAEQNVSVSLTSFREQIGWLREEGYESITKEELDGLLFESKPVPDKRILLTFDDGYYSLYRHAMEILAANNFTATLFLSTSFIGKYYDQSDFDFVRHDRQLTWPEIRELVANGWCVQAHGHNHFRMTHLDIEAVAYEVTTSKNTIEQNLGTSVNAFAFPYGIYNKAIIDELEAAGYTSAYTVHCGKLFPSVKPFQVPRIEINNMDTMESYKAKISTGYISPLIAFRAKIRDIAFANPAVKDFIEKGIHLMGYGNR